MCMYTCTVEATEKYSFQLNKMETEKNVAYKTAKKTALYQNNNGEAHATNVHCYYVGDLPLKFICLNEY